MVTEASGWLLLSPPSACGPDGPKLAFRSGSQVVKRTPRQESVGTQEQPDGRYHGVRWRHSWVLRGDVRNLGICRPRDVFISPQTLLAQVLPEWSYNKKSLWAGEVCNLFWKNIKFVVFLQLWVTLSSICLLRTLTPLSHFHGKIFHGLQEGGF